MKCNGIVLITIAISGEIEERQCQSEAAPEQDICPLHKLITERCLECRGPLISQDGDIFCARCGGTIPEIDPAGIGPVNQVYLEEDN